MMMTSYMITKNVIYFAKKNYLIFIITKLQKIKIKKFGTILLLKIQYILIVRGNKNL